MSELAPAYLERENTVRFSIHKIKPTRGRRLCVGQSSLSEQKIDGRMEDFSDGCYGQVY